MLAFALADGKTLVIVTADHECGGAALSGTLSTPKLSFATKGHTAAMVPVFVYGPQAHLFSGIYENTALHDRLYEAMDWPLQPIH